MQLDDDFYRAAIEARAKEEARGAKQCPRYTEEATKVCGGCKSISYCSSEC